MRVSIDLSLCQGHAQCEEAAPEVFEVREDGYAHLLAEEVHDRDTIAKVECAALRCPADAILLET